MTHDPLSQYRKASNIPTGGNAIPPAGIEDYVAFGTKDKVARLRICSAVPLVHSPKGIAAAASGSGDCRDFGGNEAE